MQGDGSRSKVAADSIQRDSVSKTAILKISRGQRGHTVQKSGKAAGKKREIYLELDGKIVKVSKTDVTVTRESYCSQLEADVAARAGKPSDTNTAANSAACSGKR